MNSQFTKENIKLNVGIMLENYYKAASSLHTMIESIKEIKHLFGEEMNNFPELDSTTNMAIMRIKDICDDLEKLDVNVNYYQGLVDSSVEETLKNK